MQEVLSRRLNHFADWGTPDLIVIDGGKGQLGAVLEVLNQADISIPVIGLAKRLEQIVVKTDSGFELITLSRSNPGISVLRRIRDEAHRFGVAYHTKLRKKAFLPYSAKR